MIWGNGYVNWCVAYCAERSVIYLAAIVCAMTSAGLSVGGSCVDKAFFACLYRAIYAKFPLILIYYSLLRRDYN